MSNTDSERKDKNDVYRDRNLLALGFIAAYAEVRALPRVGWWPDTDDVNGEEWAVVWADLPTGQVGWHIRREDVPDGLPKRDPNYDGYTTNVTPEHAEDYIQHLAQLEASGATTSTVSTSGTHHCDSVATAAHSRATISPSKSGNWFGRRHLRPRTARSRRSLAVTAPSGSASFGPRHGDENTVTVFLFVNSRLRIRGFGRGNDLHSHPLRLLGLGLLRRVIGRGARRRGEERGGQEQNADVDGYGDQNGPSEPPPLLWSRGRHLVSPTWSA